MPTKLFTDHNCVNKPIKWIFVEQEKLNQIIKEHFNKKLTTTIDDEKKKNDSEICWICNGKLDETKVRNHCHTTDKFRGLHIINAISN